MVATPGLPVRCLVILERECLSSYTEKGATYKIALPFKASGLFALPQGLLITRSASSSLRFEPVPVFFSLLHPLAEIKPLSYANPTEKEEEMRVWASPDHHHQYQQQQQQQHSQGPPMSAGRGAAAAAGSMLHAPSPYSDSPGSASAKKPRYSGSPLLSAMDLTLDEMR